MIVGGYRRDDSPGSGGAPAEVSMRRFLMAVAAAAGLAAAGRADDKIRVACVGDSITYGAGIKDREHNSYPAQLQKLLGDGYEVRNFGVNGRTLLSKGDLPYVKERTYQ